MALTERFRRALDAGREAVAAADKQEKSLPAQSVAALVLGGGAGELAAARAWLSGQSKRMRARAVLITNQSDVTLYQEPGIITEYLPTGASGQTPDPARMLYLQRRFLVITAKWSITHCATIGPEAERMFTVFATAHEVGQSLPVHVQFART
jgi:hypothetical protein